LQSINQSKHISIAPYVASESEAHVQFSCIAKFARHQCWFCVNGSQGHK